MGISLFAQPAWGNDSNPPSLGQWGMFYIFVSTSATAFFNLPNRKVFQGKIR
jgi:hypothetical protein